MPSTVLAPSLALLGYTALAVFVSWRAYARFRRAVGSQRLSRFRAPITFAIYGLILLAVVGSLVHQPLLLAVLLGFMAVGAVLAAVALRKTVFVAKPGALTYTPYTPIALSLAVLFLVRLAYRLVEVLWLAPGVPRSAGEFVRSPLTLGAFGLLAGYTLWYTGGLAAWRRKVIAAKRARQAQSDSEQQQSPSATPARTSGHSPQSPAAHSPSHPSPPAGPRLLETASSNDAVPASAQPAATPALSAHGGGRQAA